jgi:hypothetical protein
MTYIYKSQELLLEFFLTFDAMTNIDSSYLYTGTPDARTESTFILSDKDFFYNFPKHTMQAKIRRKLKETR